MDIFKYQDMKDPPSHGTCPECGRRVRVKKTGHVAAHTHFKEGCPATRKHPVELEGQPLVFEGHAETPAGVERADPASPAADSMLFRMPLLDGVPAHWGRTR